jgi:hypothetical protein
VACRFSLRSNNLLPDLKEQNQTITESFNDTTSVKTTSTDTTSSTDFDYVSLIKLMQNPKFDNIIINYISVKFPELFKKDGKSLFTSLTNIFSKSNFGNMDDNNLITFCLFLLVCFLIYYLLK